MYLTITPQNLSANFSQKDSERQTAGVKSTLANALKKISTKSIFMALSADDVPLDINSTDNPAVISVVNNPKYETAKQMNDAKQKTSFLLMGPRQSAY